jgi:predicted MFS family arabinose efflux permease
VTGGALLDHFTWRSAFWINVPLVVAALIAITLIVPSAPIQRIGRLDVLGAIVSTAAVATLVDAIIEAPERGWLARTTLLELGATALLGGGFVLWERRRDEPMVQVRLFKNHRFVLAALALAVTFFALFGTLFELSQYLQLVHGYTPLVAGLGAMPFAVAMATTSGTSSLVSKRLGIRGTLTVGLLLVGGGLALLSRSSADSAFAYVAAATAVVGAGMGMMMAPASLEITGSVPPRYASMAGALNSVVRELGGVLGIAVIGTIVSAAYKATPGAGRDISAAPVAFTDAMDRGVLVAAAVAFAAAILMFVGLRRRAPRAVPVPEPVREPAMV